MRDVQDTLVVRVGVDGRHKPRLDAESIVEGLGERSEAVCRAGSCRDDRLGSVEDGMIHVVDDGLDGLGACGGSRDDDAFGAREVSASFGGVREEARAFDDDVDVVGVPRDVGGVTMGVDARR